MKSYNIKCLGCGAILNDDDKMIGYVAKYEPEKTKYCQRCFNLIYYQKVDNSNLNIPEIQANFAKLNFNDKLHIFHILDVLNLDQYLILDLVNYQDQLTFVVNKMDCLPKKYNAQLTNDYIVATLESYGFKKPQILYTAKNNKSSIKKLYQQVHKISKNKQKAIFVGHTNVGKSTLINALHKLNDQDEILTISPYINTTINLIKTKIAKAEIIDTPGLPSPHNINNFITPENTKKIVDFKNSQPINFFINPEQTLLFSGLGYLSYCEGNKANFTCYFSKEVIITRCKTINADKNLKLQMKNDISITYLNSDDIEFVDHTFIMDPTKKHNISIEGLGLISLNKGIKLIKIKIRKDVGVSVNKYAII